ncbi:MAG TPA: VOC family protein [Thermoanaerobaculia bacterium]|nr:VOC family protein [Thermoanaerobaculia bacterium]
MEIRQFRVVLRAANFDRTCRFYGEALALARIQSWEREDSRGALYSAGAGSIEVLGRGRSARVPDEDFDYQGPQHKLTLTLVVPSADKAYEQILFREPNIPGGLRQDPDGGPVFETHDPDGVKILLKES